MDIEDVHHEELRLEELGEVGTEVDADSEDREGHSMGMEVVPRHAMEKSPDKVEMEEDRVE